MEVKQMESAHEATAVTHPKAAVVQPGGLQNNSRWVTVILVLIALAALMALSVIYYMQVQQGHLNSNACDVGQIARNVFTGRGFTTNLIRPFNTGFSQSGQGAFAEINRAPLFPCTVAGMFRLRSVSGQAVGSTSVVFFLAMLVAAFWLGSLLFNYQAGLLGAAVVGLSKPMLDVAISGEEWTTLGFFFTLLLCVVALHHKASSRKSKYAGIGYSAAAGALTALLYWTHYAMFLLVIPLAVYFAITGKARIVGLVAFLIVALGLMAPLVARNYSLTSSPILGAGAWDVMADTTAYPGDVFYRSVRSEQCSTGSLLMFPLEHFPSFSEKVLRRSADLLGYAVTMLGLLGLPFAAVSSLYRFKKPQTNAVRGFCYGAVAALFIALAALGVPVGCVIMFAPVIGVIAAGYLLLLADSKRLHPVYLRFLLIGLIAITVVPGVIACVWSDAHDSDKPVDRLPKILASQTRLQGPIFSSQPWTVAWTLGNPAVWLPVRDADVDQLAAVGLPMNLALITRECEKYADDDTWKALYTIPGFLDYTASADAYITEYIKTNNLPAGQKDAFLASARQVRRNYGISEAELADFHTTPTNRLVPNDILILVK